MKIYFTENYATGFAGLFEWAESAKTADILWVGLKHQIDAAFLAKCRRLRCICSPTTGLDHIDLAECQRRGIEIISLRGDTEFLRDIPATAEHTIGLILALLRRIPHAATHAAFGGWERDLFRGRELKDSTVGIVGFGRIGRQVEERLRPFGCHFYAMQQIHMDMLGECDIVTVHVPLTDETRSLFGSPEFTAMKPGSFFVNTSRGEVVYESALLDALESGHLAGAALDVVRHERGERNPRLFAYARKHPERLIITPHVAGCTVESRAATDARIAEKLAAWKVDVDAKTRQP